MYHVVRRGRYLSQYTLATSGESLVVRDWYRKIFEIFLDGIYCYGIRIADVYYERINAEYVLKPPWYKGHDPKY
jgi:hypothetical protein